MDAQPVSPPHLNSGGRSALPGDFHLALCFVCQETTSQWRATGVHGRNPAILRLALQSFAGQATPRGDWKLHPVSALVLVSAVLVLSRKAKAHQSAQRFW